MSNLILRSRAQHGDRLAIDEEEVRR